MKSPLVSVIIPVYNDAERLQKCLDCLCAQTYSPFEVIVVDNGSHNIAEVQRVVETGIGQTGTDQTNMTKTRLAATLISEAKPGSYAARNAGIAHAKGDILAFTDADCLPAPDWIARGVAQIKAHPDCGLVAGAIHIFTRNHRHPVELYESVMALSQQRFVEQDHFGATANIFTRPEVFKAVGRFNTELKSSGDVEWGQRVFAAGYEQIYAEDVRIEHPARQTFAQLAKQASRHAGGFYQVRCEQNESAVGRNLAFLRLLGFHLMPPVMFAVEMIKHPQLRSPMQIAKVVLTLAFVRAVIVKSLVSLKLGGTAERI